MILIPRQPQLAGICRFWLLFIHLLNLLWTNAVWIISVTILWSSKLRYSTSRHAGLLTIYMYIYHEW